MTRGNPKRLPKLAYDETWHRLKAADGRSFIGGRDDLEEIARRSNCYDGLISALDAVVSIRDELRLAEGIAPGRVLYVDRIFREAAAAIAKAKGE